VDTRTISAPPFTWTQINSTFRSGFITTSDLHGVRIVEFDGTPTNTDNRHVIYQTTPINYDITSEDPTVGIWAMPVNSENTLVSITP